MSPYLLSFLIGVIAGLRSLTAPAIVTWAVYLKWVHLGGGWLASLERVQARYILTVLAVGELIADKLPQMMSRKELTGFSARILTGSISGAAVAVSGAGHSSSALQLGLVLGLAGAIAGTFVGFEFRKRLTRDIGGYDFPIALLEDTIAIGGGFWIVAQIMKP